MNKYPKQTYRQRGISLTEAILGVATLGVGLGIIADLQVENLRKVKSETAAQQMQIVFDAAQSAVRDYYTDIIDGCTAGTCISVAIPQTLDGDTSVIPVELLTEENYLDAGMVVAGPAIRPNAFGQDYVISVTNLGPPASGGGDRLRVQVVTQGGQAIDEVNGASIAAAIGNGGGFRPPDGGAGIYADDTMYGAYGNWQLSQADMGGAGTAPTDGALAAVAYFGEGGVVADFLYRNPIPGQPEAQEMNANINANAFGLGNVRQIGGEPLVGAANIGSSVDELDPLNSNPDLVETGTAPQAITSNFVTNDARADFDNALVPDGVPEDNLDQAGGGALASNANTIRFGNNVDSLAGAGGLYDRGNANIVGNDAIMGIIDTEIAVRSQRLVQAVNRGDTDGQRVNMDSGLDLTNGDPLAVGGGTRPYGIESFDEANEQRTAFTTEVFDNGGALEDRGILSMSDATPTERVNTTYQATQGFTFFNDDTGQERYRQEYGTDINADAALDAETGRITMTDDDGIVRSRQEYGIVNGAPDAGGLGGTFRMADNAGGDRNIIDYSITPGGSDVTVGRVRALDNAGRVRFRQDYGLNEVGAAAANGGNIVANDETDVMRYEMRYAAADTGRLTIRDRALQDPDEERFVASYNGNNGAVIARSAGVAAGTAAVRYQQSYNGANQGQIAIRSRGQQAADQERFVAAYDDANNGRVMIRDEAANNRFADEYAGAASATTISDNVNRVRFRNEVTNANNSFSVIRDTGGVDRIEHRIAGDNTRSFMVNTAGGNAQAIIQDAGGNNRIVSFVDAGDTRFEIREPDNDLRYRYQSSTGILETRDAGNDRRFTVTAQGNTASTELAMWNEGGGQERVRLFSGNNGGSSELRLIDNNATEKVRILGGGNGNQAQIQMDGPNGNQRALLVTGVNNTPSQFQLRNPNGTDVGVVMRGNAGGTESLFDLRDNSNNVKTRMLGGNANNDRSLLQMSDGGNVKFQVNTRGNGNSTGVKIGNNGGTGTFGGSPLGPASSVLDVDDIFLRGRNTWLSNALQVHVIGSQVVRVGNSFNNGAAATCPGGNRLYVATPAWWLSPTMIGVTDITTTNGGRVSSFGTINPATGAMLSGGAFDNNTEVQVFMSAGGNLNMRARQKNDAGWRTINNGVAVVTAYCEPS